MQRIKKFGTFGGVFTPAFLTIVSVIMYLRLGWIVGQAGLLYTIGIILVANVISVATGLSLSSIATDKKVKAGGVYYMLSRSLGLSIGGAIGATMYLAFGLSIALNIVGFTESFLAVDTVRNILGMEPGPQSFRIIGATILLILTLIAYISTSLAIKTQYLVLTGIGLSWISIFAGLILNNQYHPIQPVIMPYEGHLPLTMLFAIYFPAATGFMMGAAMSGDLKDPRSSIPRGTMLAIFGGLFINLALAVCFAFFVNRELLLADPAFLQKVALIPLLVIVGIWGATLSTALGGILGGPRVIQAMAKDRMAPTFLGKGHGINNEPHRAILLTFLIALTAILIGDLNAIARIATMFFITAYAFINLAFALESWASSDFRPSFKIPRWVGWVGFGACFFVMMQIDLLAMIIAFSLLWIIWIVMKKREQNLTPVSIWHSVWASIIRHSLYRISKNKMDEPNWKPNIILFSGNPQTRPQLLEIGEALITNHGLLTLVNLKTDKKTTETSVRLRDSFNDIPLRNNKGIFFREYSCPDIFDGIESIAGTYGFPGMEPNTVLMGWAQEGTDEIRFARLIRNIINLDLNILLMDYDAQKGFGKRKTIDIWWRGSGNNGNLAINLVKFLWLSNEWKESSLRLMIENPINDEHENIYTFATEVLDNLRVNASIVIINNEIDQRPFYDIIRSESSESDIVFIGLLDIEQGEEADYIKKTHALCKDLGTVVLIRASTQFKRLNIGLKSTTSNRFQYHLQNESSGQNNGDKFIKWPANPYAAGLIKKFYNDTLNPIQELRTKSFLKILELYHDIVIEAEDRVNATFNIIERKIDTSNEDLRKQNLSILFKLTGQTFLRYERILSILQSTLQKQQQELDLFFAQFMDNNRRFYDLVPLTVRLSIPSELLQPNENDDLAMRFYKWRMLLFKRDNISQKVKFRKLVKRFYPNTFYAITHKSWLKFSDLTMHYLDHQQHTFRQFCDSLHIIESVVGKGTFSTDILNAEKEKMKTRFSDLKDFVTNAEAILFEIAEQENNNSIQRLSEAMEHIHVNAAIRKDKRFQKIKEYQLKKIEYYPSIWKKNIFFRINYNILEMTLKTAGYKMSFHIVRTAGELKGITEIPGQMASTEMVSQLLSFCNTCQKHIDRKKNIPEPGFPFEIKSQLQNRIKEIEDLLVSKIVLVANNIPRKIELLKENSTSEVFDYLNKSTPDTTEIATAQLVNFTIQNELITSLQQAIQQYTKGVDAFEKELTEISLLIRFNIADDHEGNRTAPEAHFFADQKKRVIDSALKLEMVKSTLNDKFGNISNNNSRQLSLPAFLKTAEKHKVYGRKKIDNEAAESLAKLSLRKLKTFSGNQLIKLLFAHSKHTINEQKIRSQNNEGIFTISQLHKLNEEVTVKDSVLELIPDHYQHLFMRKNNHFMEFWHGRHYELEEAAQTIARHDKGFDGALLIRGEHNSGKSFLANYICHKFLSSRAVYFIHAPFQGSICKNEFLHSLQKATEKDDSEIDTILKSLPEKSVVVIEDMELWWEKRPKGNTLIDLIDKLIETYGRKILFIITVNINAFESINKIKPIGQLMLATIDCQPIDAEDIKNIIMMRHKSGNIPFRLGNKNEDELLGWNFARLFNSYFMVSKGNIGMCLQTWMACITNFENDTLHIRSPQRPDTSVFNKLDGETMIILTHCILHKRVTTEKMERILMISPEDARSKLMYLTRASILVEPNPGVYTINPNLHQFLREKLLEINML